MKTSRLGLALLAVLMALPAWADLPSTTQIRTAKQLEKQLERAEDGALAAGAARKAVFGSTGKLANFIEDSVLTTGKTVTLHPNAIASALVRLAGEGADKAAIGEKLVAMQKAGQL